MPTFSVVVVLLLLLPNVLLAAQTLRLDLLRPEPDTDGPLLPHLRALARRDHRRHLLISARRRECESNASISPSFAMPLGSGAYARNGEYFVQVRVGTPPRVVSLVADTGSELLWLNCKYRRFGAAAGRIEAVFDGGDSASFRPIQCSSELCKNKLPFSLTTCPRSGSPCLYDYSYDDGSTAQGIFANETATIILSNGQEEALPNLVIGCTSSSSGSSFAGSDGVLGLGYSPISFAVRAAARFGSRFSYCLVDHLSPRNASNYLVFGPNHSVRRGLVRSTPLILDPKMQPFYQIHVVGISIDGQNLKIPTAVWDSSQGGGAIVDSGTSLTMLAEPAYRAVTSALNRRLESVPTVQIDPFEFCYNWTSEMKRLPKLVVHLSGSARLEPPVKSYVIDVEPGVKCLGFQRAAWPGQTVVGNILQQEHLWEFDLRNRRLRFQRSSCMGRR